MTEPRRSTTFTRKELQEMYFEKCEASGIKCRPDLLDEASKLRYLTMSTLTYKSEATNYMIRFPSMPDLFQNIPQSIFEKVIDLTMHNRKWYFEFSDATKKEFYDATISRDFEKMVQCIHRLHGMDTGTASMQTLCGDLLATYNALHEPVFLSFDPWAVLASGPCTLGAGKKSCHRLEGEHKFGPIEYALDPYVGVLYIAGKGGFKSRQLVYLIPSTVKHSILAVWYGRQYGMNAITEEDKEFVPKCVGLRGSWSYTTIPPVGLGYDAYHAYVDNLTGACINVLAMIHREKTAPPELPCYVCGEKKNSLSKKFTCCACEESQQQEQEEKEEGANDEVF